MSLTFQLLHLNLGFNTLRFLHPLDGFFEDFVNILLFVKFLNQSSSLVNLSFFYMIFWGFERVSVNEVVQLDGRWNNRESKYNTPVKLNREEDR